jgi:hypothetical protein
VRQGASWTAAYHRQLRVAAVARPVRGSVGAFGVLAAERSWLLLAQTTSAQRSVQPVPRAQAWSPWSTLPAGTPRRRSPVSSRRCPPIRFRRPGSGCPAVRCPVTWGSSSRGSGARPSAVQPSGVQPSGVRPVGPDASVSSHAQTVALGTRSRWPGDRDHRNRWRPLGLPGRRRLDRCRGGRDAGDAAQVALVSGRSVADPGHRVGCGPRRPRLPTERPGRPGRRSEPPRRGRRRGGHEGQAAARGGGTRHLAGVLGWGRDHGGWSSPSLTAGWVDPEGPLEVPAGMGVRPQRGPGRQRARPARCRQRSDLRRWVVGLPGLEPGTSSLSDIEGSALCSPAFLQVAAIRQGRSNALLQPRLAG